MNDKFESESEEQLGEKNTNANLQRRYMKYGSYHSAIFMFDLTDKQSFTLMEKQFEDFRSLCRTGNACNIAFVGSKYDIIRRSKDRRAIKEEVVDEWLDIIEDQLKKESTGQQMEYFEVSAQEDLNIE